MFKCFKEAIWTFKNISSGRYLELLKEDTFMIQIIYILNGGGHWGPERPGNIKLGEVWSL